MASTPSSRRQLDGVAAWSLTDRFSQHGHVLAERGLCGELSHPTLWLICAQVRWLGHVGIARYDEKNYQGWKILGVPTKITNREGLPIDMGGLISDVLKDGDTVYVSHSLEPHDVERQD